MSGGRQASEIEDAVIINETAAQKHARKIAAELHAGRVAARERYEVIALVLKEEAGVQRHFEHKSISGIAWTGSRKILAPKGITRRQLYVLAHECGHVVLHSSGPGAAKPGHVKEHEAETYAHRAFARYGLEVPEKSARWAREYVGQWIKKDEAEGMSICSMAKAFAAGDRAPSDPLPSVDGHPRDDFSKSIDRFIAKGTRLVEKQERLQPIVEMEQPAMTEPDGPPNACGTCVYFQNYRYDDVSQCDAFARLARDARTSPMHCNNGNGWRPHRREIEKLKPQSPWSIEASSVEPQIPERSFLSRLGDAIIDRISGRYRYPPILEQQKALEPPHNPGNVIKIEDSSKRTG